MNPDRCAMPQHGRPDAASACCRPPPETRRVDGDRGFWRDSRIWRRAASNTAHCLLGCALGDIAAMTLIPVWHPGIGMAALMACAMLAGIASSLLLETLILRWREGLPWTGALRTAWAMSLASMAAMELVMNAVDLLLLGGQRLHWHQPAYWLAWLPALGAGFLSAWPYNYYTLRAHGRSCH